jgi:hypothetical protein
MLRSALGAAHHRERLVVAEVGEGGQPAPEQLVAPERLQPRAMAAGGVDVQVGHEGPLVLPVLSEIKGRNDMPGVPWPQIGQSREEHCLRDDLVTRRVITVKAA